MGNWKSKEGDSRRNSVMEIKRVNESNVIENEEKIAEEKHLSDMGEGNDPDNQPSNVMDNLSAEEKNVDNPDTQENDLASELPMPSPPASPEEVSPSSSPPPPNPSAPRKIRAKSAIPAPTAPTKEATEHLSKELQGILKTDSAKDGFSIELIDDNLFKWNIYLFNFDENTQIKEDLQIFKEATGKDKVLLEVTFPFHYPAGPPFIRVVYPRFHQYTGHITIGGSVCIKDLTSSGWNSKYELFPFIIMMRNLLLEGGALIDMDNLSEYTEQEASEAFNRVARQHGWIP